MTQDKKLEINKRWELPFPVNRVYAAWVSEETVIPPATRMEILPEVGGHYRLIMESPDFSGRNEGEFLRVEPNARVTYTWQWNGDREVSTIDVRFEAIDAGTLIRLKHTDFQHQQSVEQHDSGWDSYIVGFQKHLEAD